MRTVILISGLIFISFSLSAQTAAEYLQQGNDAYKAKKLNEAKALYLKAAALNCPDADFALYYKFSLTDHLIKAARGGNSDAVAYIFDELFFRAETPIVANPELAYQVYKEALGNNPHLAFYNMENQVADIQKCLEAGPFDTTTFMKKYNLTADSFEGMYAVWELAAEASRGGRFGKPDPKLVFQLVCRGGSVPAELEAAIDTAYQCWKENRVFEFNPCDYIGSGMGIAYCTNKEAERATNERQKNMAMLAPQLKNNAGPLLPAAYQKAVSFFESKATSEEGNGGSGYMAWTIGSETTQEDAFVLLIEKANLDSLPQPFTGDENSDKKLNKVYQNVMQKLKAKPISGFNFEISTGGVHNTQVLWLSYRDAIAQLLSRIMPRITEVRWKQWLTEQRIADLQAILDMQE